MNTVITIASVVSEQTTHALDQILVVGIVAVVVGMVLAVCLKAGLRYAQMTPEERQMERDARAAAAAEANARSIAAEEEYAAIRNAQRESEAAERAAKAVEAHAGPQESAGNNSIPGLVVWGGMLLFVGGVILLSSLLFFGVEVHVPGSSMQVNNIGLLNRRLIGVLCGLALSLMGGLCFLTQCIVLAIAQAVAESANQANRAG